MRPQTLLIAASLALIAVPAVAQDFLGRLARSAAESAARRLTDHAVTAATSPRPANAPATRPVLPPGHPQASSPATAVAEAPAATGDLLVLRDKMPVISSDGVRVAETIHILSAGYAADHSFFTTDTTYRLRRLYPHEVIVRGDTVHLKMTAAQYRARTQNPEYHPG